MFAIGVILTVLGFFFSHILLIIGIILIVLGLLGNGYAHFGPAPAAGRRRYWF